MSFTDSRRLLVEAEKILRRAVELFGYSEDVYNTLRLPERVIRPLCVWMMDALKCSLAGGVSTTVL